ncbi:MAG: hypothetical protein P4L76_17960 [Beijerinckiaceae bacterium]|nr:hypothetical protein [Beijerinckiaceae bacterium]
MKPMRTELTPLRLARCKAVIDGYGPERTFRAFRDLCGINPRGLIAMLTEEAIEKWAFKLMDDRRAQNRMNARNRAAMRQAEAAK